MADSGDEDSTASAVAYSGRGHPFKRYITPTSIQVPAVGHLITDLTKLTPRRSLHHRSAVDRRRMLYTFVFFAIFLSSIAGFIVKTVRPVSGPDRAGKGRVDVRPPQLSLGTTIVDQSVSVIPDPDYQLPPAALAPPLKTENQATGGSYTVLQKAEEVVTGMLAKGLVLGKDVVNKAKSFDEKHLLTSTFSSKVASFDKKIGLTKKISIGTSVVNEKVKEIDQKFQVSEKAKSTFASAEQKVSSAGSAIMKNRYVFTGASFVAGAFNKVTKAAGEVGQKTSWANLFNKTENQATGGSYTVLQKAEEVVTGMLAKGLVLGKDAVNKAKFFDEKHQLTSTASSKVASFDKKIGLTEKISIGTSVVSGKVKEIDQKFQVSEKAKSAFASAEQKVSNSGSAIMKNRYVFTGASFVAGAFNKVTKAAGEVGQKTSWANLFNKTENQATGGSYTVLQKAEEVVTGMLAKGLVLGKDVVNKAKSFDEKHQLTSTASSKVASFDKKIGLTEKISIGTSVVSGKVKEIDQKFQVSEKAKSAFASAEQKVSNSGSAIMKNRYVFTGASFVAGAFNKVTKAAGEVGQKTSWANLFNKTENQATGGSYTVLQKAEEVVTGMLAKGLVLGKDVVNKAKSFDEKHQLTSTASSKVASFDKKIGLTEKISIGTSVVNEKVKEVDHKFQVSEKAKSAFAAAEQKVSNAGSTIMKNRYVFTGASFVAGAFNKVTKAAGEVGQKTSWANLFNKTENQATGGSNTVLQKAEEVVTGMLAKNLVLDKDVVNKAKSFDEKHQLTSTVSSKVASFDKKIGLTEKISIGTSVVSEKFKEVDQKFQVSKKAMSAFAAAEQKVSRAESAIMKNIYIFTGASFVGGAFNNVMKAAGEVGQKTREKVGMIDDEQRRKMVDDFAQIHLSESPTKGYEPEEEHSSKLVPVKENRKSGDVVTGMLTKGLVLGKEAVNKAKSFNEKHHLTSPTSSKVVIQQKNRPH